MNHSQTLDTVQLWLAPGVNRAEWRESLAQHCAQFSAAAVHITDNLEGSFGGGDLTLDIAWQDRPGELGLEAVGGLERQHRISYHRSAMGSREYPLRDGIWRTAVFAMHADADRERCQRDLLAMPAYMAGIRRWSLGWSEPGDDGRRYLVWQQEYRQVDDLLGEYLMHPYHWGWVDRHFDPDHPDYGGDTLYHCFGPMAESLLPAETP